MNFNWLWAAVALLAGWAWWRTHRVHGNARRVQPARRPADVDFRIEGERGMGGPVFGSVMCADGTYLTGVWESQLHISADGRWLQTSGYDGESPLLVDRQGRCSWLLDAAQAQALGALFAQLPRWSEEAPGDSPRAEGQAAFAAWLQVHGVAAAQPLVAFRDLWLPARDEPLQSVFTAPLLAPAPTTGAPVLRLTPYWPASLRQLRYPLAALEQPQWQLLCDDQPQPWLVSGEAHLAWRADGQAFALYAWPEAAGTDYPLVRPVVWSAESGWQQWPENCPVDRKRWAVGLHFPEDEAVPGGQDPAAPASALYWDGAVLAQCMALDTPNIGRLHSGTELSCTVSDTDGCAGHADDGRVLLANIPRTRFAWLRDPRQPDQWRARSAGVAGQPLVWSLRRPAKDAWGETAAYGLQWGDEVLPGDWALEHVVVQGRWAVLMPHDRTPSAGGQAALQIWDGVQLHCVDLPWAVVRLLPVPGSDGGAAVRVGVVALTHCVAEADQDVWTATWRWPLKPVSARRLANDDNDPVYAIRHLAPDGLGRWQLLPRWREVSAIQHPCADGDYVWRDAAQSDALWWWGGEHAHMHSYWDEDRPRFEGVSVTRSGAVLCGTGPSACPHPQGEGWVVLERVNQGYTQPDEWRLHWLQPAQGQLLSLALQAEMPLLLGWDDQGVHWRETDETAPAEAAAVQTIAPLAWEQAARELLLAGPRGLSLRAQDMRYAQAILAQDDWPWQQG